MKKFLILSILLILAFGNSVLAQPVTVGLIQHDAGSLDDGYVLFSPNNATTTYLIDKCGYVRNKWVCHNRPGFSACLLPDGTLLRTNYMENKNFVAGGSGGMIQKLDWEGNILWSYTLSNKNECMHHDIKPMPNGNILAISWDRISYYDALNQGRKAELIDSCVWSEKIIELRPIGTDSAEIVWEWKVWDHIVQNADKMKPHYADIASHPELIDLNFTISNSLRDWLHFNSVDYNEKLDQILITSHSFSEIWIIDHSTTTKEAASHSGGKSGKGGDLLYRWGNPLAYGYGKPADQVLFLPHDATWIPEGYPNENCISIFNNQRMYNNVPFSSADIIKPPVDSNGNYSNSYPYGPNSVKWSFTTDDPKDFSSPTLSSVQQLSNGNVLICNGNFGTFIEVDSNKKEVWYYINPVTIFGITAQGASTQMTNQVFRCTYYPSDYSAFKGKDLTKKSTIEDKNRFSADCSLDTTYIEDPEYNLSVYPNPAKDYITVNTDLNPCQIAIFDFQGQELITQNNSRTISTKELPNGIYLMRITDSNGHIVYNKIAITR
jgi:hypothetical protein